jgi:N-acetyl sugar amidotransferase
LHFRTLSANCNLETGNNMRRCKICLDPDTRPLSEFDEDSICLPCRYQAQSSSIDWTARRRELQDIAAWARTRNVSGYDCVIPVSGGKDSHRQALYCRDELGLKPLLASCAYPPEEQTERGARNIGNLISLGFDCVYVSPGPETWRNAMQAGFRRFANIYKSTELPLYATGAHVATMYHIPLVVYGENPSLSWGAGGGSYDGDANQLKTSNTLAGGDISWLLEAGIGPERLNWYVYPSEEEFERVGLRMIYLGYYIPDFNDFVNGPMAVAHGLTGREGDDADPSQSGNIEPFDALDCDFLAVNQMIKRVKFGFGKVSEQCSGAIRAGEMTRDEAIEFIEKYDGKCSQRYIDAFCRYTGIPEDEFWEIVERYRSRDVWTPDGNSWKFKVPLQ